MLEINWLIDKFTDFVQVHITEASEVADHCVAHTLSDPREEKFCHTCNHLHNHVCSSCEGLKSVLSSIQVALNDQSVTLAVDERDDLMYACQQAIQAINAWKAHQLRSLRQDKCRIDVLQELNPNEVLVTQDWAMKFLPQKYRETQADWFGKRGLSWHISKHIAQNCSQDSSIVIAIMEHILRCLKAEHPEITTASFRRLLPQCNNASSMFPHAADDGNKNWKSRLQ